jgi:hypothetical protein
LALAVGPVQAHFIYLIPAKDQKAATMVFSDTLAPDEAVPINKIAMTKLFALDAAGKPVAVKMTEMKHHFDVTADGERPVMIAGTCQYGVIAKKGESFLLLYHPKTVLMGPEGISDLPWLLKGSKELPLEMVKADESKVRVLFQGKPLPAAEVALFTDAEDSKAVEGKTDAEGEYNIEAAFKSLDKKMPPSLVAVRIRHVEKKEGELDGKKYTEVRHYATMVIRPTKGKKAAKEKADEEVVFLGKDKEADPGATKLLADARAARALWHKFPGFTARVEINQDGKKIPCKLDVSAAGKVDLRTELADLSPEHDQIIKKVRGEIISLVSHRLPGEKYETPCAFADKVEDHPQGRLILVLNDELHSSYRIRDRQILEVNRTSGGGRFTISVLENYWSKDKTYLPAHYVVNTWDKGGTLTSATAHRNTWLRLGSFDLPETYSTVNAGSGGLSVRLVTFSGHKLAAGAE